MENLIYGPAFILALGIIVFVHEFGHHIVARLCGVRVLVFSFGFGKRLWGFPYKGTDYRISAIPLGGYVRMGGELPDDYSGNDPSEFLSKPRWVRIVVYLAGPAMNVVLSLALTTLVFMHGIEMQAFQELSSVVGHVKEGSPAEAAGLEPGDRIVQVEGNEVDKWKDVSFAFLTAPDQPVVIGYQRGEEVFQTVVTPNKTERDQFGDAGVFPKSQFRVSRLVADSPAERAGFRSGDIPRAVDGRPVTERQEFIRYIEEHPGEEIEVQVLRGEDVVTLAVVPQARDEDGKGQLGVLLGIYRQLPLGEAVVASVSYNVEIVVRTGEILSKLFSRKISARGTFSGPIEIGRISGEAAKRGFRDWIFIVGFLSISIGLMNLLPIPLLDGGNITVLLVESVMQRDLSLVAKERIAQVGFVMLMLLMAMVFYFDLSKNGILPGS